MRLLLTIFLGLSALACKRVETDYDKYVKASKDFEALLDASGENYTLVKEHTTEKNYRVFRNEASGEYVAYNLSSFNGAEMKTIDSFLAVSGDSAIVRNLEHKSEWVVSSETQSSSNTYTSCDNEGQCYSYDGGSTYTEVDTSGYVDFYYGGGFKFDNSQRASHDLETLASLSETAAITLASAVLSSKYSLSSSRAEELARLSYRYKKLENARELTMTERDAFAVKALGVSLGQIERTLKEKAQGDDSDYLELLEKAAVVNKTTPEKIGDFFTEFLIEE